MSNTFVRNNRLKWVKNEEKSKQHLAAEFLVFENY